MNRYGPVCRGALGLIAVIAWLPAMAAQSASRTPDLTGIWRIVDFELPPPVGPGPPPSLRAALPLLRPDVAARIMANARGGPPADRGYCAPAAVSGPLGYYTAPPTRLNVNFEILSSPGRLTVIDEMSMVRRLYLRATPPADALDESNAGTSIARWNGAELVVHTTGLNPHSLVILSMPGTEIGGGAQIEEHFTLVAPDQLQIVTTVTAPALYAAPVTTTNRYLRDPNYTMLEISVCAPDDRAFDNVSKTERFDATPPSDLPPPPGR